MRLDAGAVAFLTKDELKVLTAVEQGSRNHEIVPTVLIQRLSGCRTGIHKILSSLCKLRAIGHHGQKAEGYTLTYIGFDYLALAALQKHGSLDSVGARLGCGKEADIHVAGLKGEKVCLKIHREGRTSFRTVKSNRDYLRPNQFTSSWLYLSKLAAKKEFAFLKMFYETNIGMKVPKPIAVSRHCIVMEHVDGVPLRQVMALENPVETMEELFSIIIKLAQAGFIHGDFNEFNILVGKDETITIIDFPQIVTVAHPNADELFHRDINCVKCIFEKKFGFIVSDTPKFFDVVSQELIESCQNKKGSRLGQRCIPEFAESAAWENEKALEPILDSSSFSPFVEDIETPIYEDIYSTDDDYSGSE